MENNENQNVNQATPVANQTATPEIKTEEVATKNKKEKKTKEKKPKERKEQMDTKDQLWLFGGLLFLILAFVPFLLRSFDPNYDEFRDEKKTPTTENPEEVVKKNLYCNKDVIQSDYSYHIEITAAYENDEPVNTTITYTLTTESAATTDINTINIIEYQALEEITESGVTSDESEVTLTDAGKNQKVFTIGLNFKTNPELLNNTSLDDYNKMYTIQKSNYLSNDYDCTAQ